MAGIDIHSASPLSSVSSEQLSCFDDHKQIGEDISRNASVSPNTTEPSLRPAAQPTKLEVQSQSLLPIAMPAPSAATRPSRSVPRLNTRSSISEAPLPWKIDETSSPYTPTSHGRKSSFVPPPPRRINHRGSTDSTQPDTTYPSSSSTASPYHTSSPYSTTSSSNHIVDLSNPPGYTQDARASFSDHRSTQVPTYDNSTPFYQNNYPSYTSSMASPMTPTHRGRGILDNDPSLYLRNEADADEESVWDTATRWTKAAGKRVSQGEQQIWRMVSAITSGEGDR